MRLLKKRFAVVISTLSLGYLCAPATTAQAEHEELPCNGVVTIICQFLPVAPEWEGDIDLTQDQPSPDPTLAEPEFRMPADYCFNGCI